jgi:hypothetical protein
MNSPLSSAAPDCLREHRAEVDLQRIRDAEQSIDGCALPGGPGCREKAPAPSETGYPPETSRALEHNVIGQPRGVSDGSEDIFILKKRIVFQDFLMAGSMTQEIENVRDAYSFTPHTRLPPHLPGSTVMRSSRFMPAQCSGTDGKSISFLVPKSHWAPLRVVEIIEATSAPACDRPVAEQDCRGLPPARSRGAAACR